MRLRLLLCTSLFFFLFCNPLFAEDELTQKTEPVEIVISASQVAREAKNTASAVTVFDEEDIKKSQRRSVLDLLREVPGVDVVQSGGPGGNTAVFIRGTNSEHTLVILDGVELNNPASTSRFYNFVDMSLSNIERIEVLRGPQSGLYGSDAIGGVIRIFTKKGDGKPRVDGNIEAGSYETGQGTLRISGSEKDLLDYSLSYEHQERDGFSSAQEAGFDLEDDGYRNEIFSGNLGLSLTKDLSLRLIGRQSDSRSELDNGGFAMNDDPNRVIRKRDQVLRAEGSYLWLDGDLQHIFGVGRSDSRFFDDNPLNEGSLDLLHSRYDGELVKYDLKNIYHLSSESSLILGAETEEESARSSYASDGAFGAFSEDFLAPDSRNNGIYSEAILGIFDEIQLTLAGRVDDGSGYSNEATYRIGPVWYHDETDTKLAATYGTGFKYPSLFQRFSSYGDPDLSPEESKGGDIGIEQGAFSGNLKFRARYFENDIDSLIDFDPQTFIFSNIESAETSGAETGVTWYLAEDWRMDLDYSYLDATDAGTGESLLRRARQQVLGSLHYAPLESSHDFGIRARMVGSRFDNDFRSFPAERVELGSYTVVDLLGSYHVCPGFEIFGRIENVFDKSYQEVLGYGTSGIAAYAGIRFAFGGQDTRDEM